MLVQHRRFRQLRIWLLLGLGFLGLLLSLGVYFVTNHLMYPGQPQPEPIHTEVLSQPEASGFTLQNFMVTAPDGVVLSAQMLTPIAPATITKTTPTYQDFAARLQAANFPLPQPEDAPRGTILMLHGISGIKEHNLAIAQRLVVAGYRCILYDSRAHGDSGGEFVSYGWREVDDAKAVLDAAIAKFSPESLEPIGLFGRSLGASVSLQLLPQEPRIQSAVLVSPFSELSELMIETAQPYLGRWGVELVLPLIAQVMQWRTQGFDPRAIAPMQTAQNINIPILLIHGQADDVILPHHSDRNYDAIAYPDKTLQLVPEGTHQDVLEVGGDELYQEMVEFYARTLATNPQNLN